MNTAYGMLIAITALFGLGSFQTWPSNAETNDDPPEDCQCSVVNKSDFYPKGTDIPLCTDPVTGVRGPAYSVGITSFPAGQSPKPGVCGDGDCEEQQAKGCTYTDVIVNVTLSPCAAALWGYKPGEHVKVKGDRGVAIPWTAPLPPFVQNPLNQNWTCDPPDAANTDKCGTEEMTATMKALKADGTTAFTVVFSFGCGSCKASRS